MADILTLTEATPSAELQAMGNPDIDVERYELVRQALVEIAAVLPAAHEALHSQDDHSGLMQKLQRIDEMSRAAQQLAVDAGHVAERSTVPISITKVKDDLISTDHEQRMEIAYEASGQIDALVGVLKREQQASSDRGADITMATLLRRVEQLNGVVFAVLHGDDADPTERLRAVVNAGRMESEVLRG